MGKRERGEHGGSPKWRTRLDAEAAPFPAGGIFNGRAQRPPLNKMVLCYARALARVVQHTSCGEQEADPAHEIPAGY